MLRWLHLSDVHESATSPYVRGRMYDQILRHVDEHARPDIVFLTGDLAFSGAAEEYEELSRSFITPLTNILADDCLIFTVPGNHDVDRSASVKPRLWIADEQERGLFQSPDKKGGRKRNDALIPRFASYADFDHRVSSWGTDWVRSEDGAALWRGRVRDMDLAVVGLNTAWLCQDDDDFGRLTPGRLLFERALEKAAAEAPELLFVLGHHPLNALATEHQPSGDGRRVRERLKQAHAIYLHGHLHLTDSEELGNHARGAVTVQAPSAFQAHDSETWRNGLLWGEASPGGVEIILEPYEWDEHRAEYKFDARGGYNDERVPGREAFRVRRPGADGDAPAAGAGKEDPAYVPAEGWEVVDRGVIQKIRESPPSTPEMIGFFDGRLPTWRLVAASALQPRTISENLAARFRAMHDGQSKPGVVLLTAAGGEGKSTAILQTAVMLVEDETQTWRCLHRKSANAALPETLFAELPVLPQSSWLILIDDADNIAARILAALRQAGSRTDIHLLLAARDADWQGARLPATSWQPVADFRSQVLSGVTPTDVDRIVSGWAAYGPEAMGLLKDKPESEAAAILLHHARELATRNEAGELLGALLIARQGDDMRAHVRILLASLPLDPTVGRHSVRDVYAMVAAMHAENQLYLSSSVLAYALGVTPDELETRALDLLRREAMLDAGEAIVLSRHRRIAEAAVTVMREDGYEVRQWYPILAAAARKHFLARRTTPGIADWTFGLARHFAQKGERWGYLARQVARAVYMAEPANYQSLTAYASICRETGHAHEAMEELRKAASTSSSQREVLLEWGAVAGTLEDYGLNAWLTGRATSDQSLKGDFRWSRCLLSLAVAFRNLHEKTKDRAFLLGQAACAQLTSRLDGLNHDQKHFLKTHTEYIKSNNIGETTVNIAVENIQKAIVLASYEILSLEDQVYFEKLIGDPSGYKFGALARLF